MLYICIPAYNEAPTIGVLLWCIRRIFEELPREYELIVLDDGSTDSTPETLKPYSEVLPLTVLRNAERRGYGAALDRLARTVVGRTRYPRRDALVIMQGDFTDQPTHLPEMVKRFEGGADVVVGVQQKGSAGNAPRPVRLLRRAAPWLLGPLVRAVGVPDQVGTYRLVRVSVVRDVLRAVGTAPLVSQAGWAANAELLFKLSRAARRIETVDLTPRYDLRSRQSRVRPWVGALDLYRFGAAARGTASPTPAAGQSMPDAPTVTTST